jgi:hypothetical protein
MALDATLIDNPPLGGYHPFHGLRMLRLPPQDDPASLIAHEVAHHYEALHVKQTGPGDCVISSGFHDLAADISLAREGTMDVATHRMMQHAGFDRVTFRYTPDSTVMEAIIEKAAAHHNVNPKDVALQAVKAAWTGAPDGLDILKNSMSKEQFELLMRQSSITPSGNNAVDLKAAAALADALKIPEVMPKLEDLTRGKPRRLFPWLD